jgi:hypothetical protein
MSQRGSERLLHASERESVNRRRSRRCPGVRITASGAGVEGAGVRRPISGIASFPKGALIVALDVHCRSPEREQERGEPGGGGCRVTLPAGSSSA